MGSTLHSARDFHIFTGTLNDEHLAISIATLKSSERRPQIWVNVIGREIANNPQNLEGVARTTGLQRLLQFIHVESKQHSMQNGKKAFCGAIYTNYIQNSTADPDTRWKQYGVHAAPLPRRELLNKTLGEVAVEIRGGTRNMGLTPEIWSQSREEWRVSGATRGGMKQKLIRKQEGDEQGVIRRLERREECLAASRRIYDMCGSSRGRADSCSVGRRVVAPFGPRPAILSGQ